MATNEVEDIEKISTENIFEDFQNDSNLQNEIQKTEIEAKKDFYYYFSLVGDIFKYVNILFFILILTGVFYVTIQKNETGLFDEAGFLQPVCGILLGNTSLLEETTCSPVISTTRIYTDKIAKLKEETLDKGLNVLKEAYTIEDLVNSDKVRFVLDKTQNKNDPLFILNKFDVLKNEFLSVDKTQIQCSDIKIEDNTFKAKCTSYSSSWDSRIPGFNGSKGSDTVGGTSISIASSFLNFLELDKNIIMENKQKSFSQEQIVGGAYTYKTDFDVNFSYKTDTLLF